MACDVTALLGVEFLLWVCWVTVARASSRESRARVCVFRLSCRVDVSAKETSLSHSHRAFSFICKCESRVMLAVRTIEGASREALMIMSCKLPDSMFVYVSLNELVVFTSTTHFSPFQTRIIIRCCVLSSSTEFLSTLPL